MRHVCFIETSRERRFDPRFNRPGMAPSHVFDCREDTPFAIPSSDNSYLEEELDRLPPDLTSIRLDWFGDSRLLLSHHQATIQRLKELVVNSGREKFRLLYLDNEEWPRDSAALNTLLDPLRPHFELICNFNSGDRMRGWWGATAPTIGNAGNLGMYEMTTNPAVKRAFEAIRNNSKFVPEFPICEVRHPTTYEMHPEINTQNVFARTRQIIMYNASHGNGVLNCAEYMIPDHQIDANLDVIERANSDADLIYPL